MGGGWGVFLRHVILLAIVICHRATSKKCGAVKDKLFPAFISQRGTAGRGAARHGAARRSSRCSPEMISNTVYLF